VNFVRKNPESGKKIFSRKAKVSQFVESAIRNIDFPARVAIFDTTLRDGEGTPSVNFTLEEKVEIAKALDALGVAVIEAGSPVTSKTERETFKKIVELKPQAKICGLARVLPQDIEACVECDVDRVHTFIATSDTHLRYKLRMTEDEALEKTVRAVGLIKSHGLQCEFSCEDATRTPLKRLKTFYQAAEDAGADIVNIPDTLGVMEPEAMINLVTDIRGAIKVPVSLHCHNDFGLAAVNSLAGVKAGAEQVHVAVNGLGERAGNASLEQVTSALEMLYQVSTGINLSLLTRTSRIVQKYSLVNLPPNYPIVGENAFTQETGIHVHGVVAKKETYEPFPPELVGQKRRITIGKSTGHHAIERFLQKSNITFNRDQMREIVNRVRTIVAVRKKISDKEVLLITKDVTRGLEKKEHVKLVDLQVKTGTINPTAKVTLKIQEKTVEAESEGVGPVDSCAKAIMSALGEQFNLSNYELEAVSGGADSLCQVMVVMEDMKGNTSIGSTIGPDIVKTSVEAMIESINQLYRS
jgi:2-isopropylmalate synthase